jgi:hypothetical protein
MAMCIWLTACTPKTESLGSVSAAVSGSGYGGSGYGGDVYGGNVDAGVDGGSADAETADAETADAETADAETADAETADAGSGSAPSCPGLGGYCGDGGGCGFGLQCDGDASHSTYDTCIAAACTAGSIAFGECGAFTAGDVTFTTWGCPGTTKTGGNWTDPADLVFTNTTKNAQQLVVYCWKDSICNHLNYEPGDPLGAGGSTACAQAIPPNGTLTIASTAVKAGCMYAMIAGTPPKDSTSCGGT